MDIRDIKEITQGLDLLYVEDNRELREKKTLIFNELFKRVDVAKDGYDGLEFYKNRDYDLIITDLNMPVMSGLEMLKKIKSLNPNQKCIVYSAYSELEYHSYLQELNIIEFLVKPVSLDKFLTAIEKSVIEEEVNYS